MKRILQVAGILLGLALAIGLAAGGVIGYQGYEMYQKAIAEKSLAQRVEEIRAQPHYTTLDELPDIYEDAVLSVEDRRFYSHGGIDPISIVRAALIDLKAGSFVQGGSTITQQLAKNLCFTQEKDFSRKAAEVFAAFALEKDYSKQEILELYINSIYYGRNYYSIYNAAMGYFGKTPDQMTDSECTLLAGLPNAPSAYSPDESPELARERQAQVLKAMVRNKKLTQPQADAILAGGSAADAA